MKRAILPINYAILQNKYILYFFFLASIAFIVFSLSVGEINYIVLFIAISLIISRFKKNMIIILTGALILTYLVKYGFSFFIYRGGVGAAPTLEGIESGVGESVASSTDRTDALKEQQQKITELTEQLKDVENTNLQEIARLTKLLEEAKRLQATTAQ